MKITKKILFLSLIASINIVFCGAGLFNKADIEIDTNKNKIYKLYSIEDVLSNQTDDNFNLCCVSGIVTEISKNNKKLSIKSASSDKVISLDTGSVVDLVKNINKSDRVTVYGIAEKGMFGKEAHINVESMSKTDIIERSGNVYCLANGKTQNKSDMVERTLNDGKIKYYVPKYWTGDKVEIDVQTNGLGYAEGYQYVLNKTPGTTDNEPESFFVCYFKYEGNLQKSTPRDAAKPIEKAIVKNIEDKEEILKFPTREVKKTYYDAKYQYYLGNYNDPVQANDAYYTEYVFEQDGEEGLVMYIYVYSKPKHIDDIMFVTRFLEIK